MPTNVPNATLVRIHIPFCQQCIWKVSLPGMHEFVGPTGPTTTIYAPFGYGQDEDKYEGPTFAHVPTVVRPVIFSHTTAAVA